MIAAAPAAISSMKTTNTGDAPGFREDDASAAGVGPSAGAAVVLVSAGACGAGASCDLTVGAAAGGETTAAGTLATREPPRSAAGIPIGRVACIAAVDPASATADSSSALPSSSAVWNRSAGSFAMQRSTIASTCGGIPTRGFFTDGGIGASLICLISTAAVDVALNGTSPASIS